MVAFNNTAYFEAFRSASTLNLALGNEESSAKFSYGQISFSKFSEKYSSSGWVGRRFVAIPFVAVGLVKTIYNLAMAVFSPTLSRIHFFQAGRNLQDLGGWVATIVNDRLGQYHVQESEFHQSFYDSFFAKHGVYSLDRTVRFNNFKEKFDQLLNEGKFGEAGLHLDLLLGIVHSSKDSLLERLADVRTMNREIGGAWESIKQIQNKTSRNDKKRKLVNALVRDKRLEEALKFAQTIDGPDKGYLLKKIADAYLADVYPDAVFTAEKSYRNALAITQSIDKVGKNSRLIKIANAYRKKGNLAEARRVLQMFEFNKDRRSSAYSSEKSCMSAMHMKIVGAYYKKGESFQALLALKNVEESKEKAASTRSVIGKCFESLPAIMNYRSSKLGDLYYESFLGLNMAYLVQRGAVRGHLKAFQVSENFEEQIYEALELMLIKELMIESYHTNNQLAFTDLMTQDAGFSFVAETVDEWMCRKDKSKAPLKRHVFIECGNYEDYRYIKSSYEEGDYNYLESEFASIKLETLEKLISEKIKTKFTEFLQLAKEKDPYSVLGVDRNASQSTIKKACENLQKQIGLGKIVKGESETQEDFDKRQELANKRWAELNDAWLRLKI